VSGLLDPVHGNHGDKKMARWIVEEDVDWNYTDTILTGRCGRKFVINNTEKKYNNCWGGSAYAAKENHTLPDMFPLPQCLTCLVEIIETLQKYSLLYTVDDLDQIRRFEGIRFRCPPEDKTRPAWTIPTTRDRKET
jgi:hypothetical protein